MSSLVNPLLLIFLPSLYIFGAAIGLLQFQVLFAGLASLVAKAKSIPYLEFAVPVLKTLVQFLERVFGPASKFAPNSTQVILVAVMLAVIVHCERSRR